MPSLMRTLASISLLWLAFAACGTKSVATHSATDTRIIEATERRTLPGVKGAKPMTDYKLTLIWKEDSAPYNFLWKREADWYSCRFDITKGDTIYVYANKKTAQPKDITGEATNTLYYNTQKSAWKALEAPAIKKQPDVIMP